MKLIQIGIPHCKAIQNLLSQTFGNYGSDTWVKDMIQESMAFLEVGFEKAKASISTTITLPLMQQ